MKQTLKAEKERLEQQLKKQVLLNTQQADD